MISEIDLHMHSNVSDGTDSSEELMRKAIRAGLRFFSVTDHDAAGVRKVPDELGEYKSRFVIGAEFSCKTEAGKCHILGYGFDPDAPELSEVLKELRRLRAEKLDRRLAFLKDSHGIVFDGEEIDSLHALTSAGKPHIALLLVKHGYSLDISSAINAYLKNMPKSDDRIPAARAIHAVKAAGGIAVWAHPLGGEGEKRLSREEFTIRLDLLINDGIGGLECFYSRYSLAECEFLEAEALKRGLFVSAGSDYHGKNKNISVGEINSDRLCIPADRITIYSELVRRNSL